MNVYKQRHSTLSRNKRKKEKKIVSLRKEDFLKTIKKKKVKSKSLYSARTSEGIIISKNLKKL